MPPTTPRGERRYYNINPLDNRFRKECANDIKGEYIYSPLEELGVVGFSDGIVRTKDYKRLFHTER